MDMPVATEGDLLIDETGFEYRLTADGEREYYHPEPGEDPGYDAWFIAEVEQALRESERPDAVWISNDQVKAETRAFWAARGIDFDALDTE